MAVDCRFGRGDVVEVFDRNVTQSWHLAFVQQTAPYRGSEGYYIAWFAPLGGGTWQQWHSRGGWVQGRDVRAADTCDVRECGSWREPGMRVCRAHMVGMSAAAEQAL